MKCIYFFQIPAAGAFKNVLRKKKLNPCSLAALNALLDLLATSMVVKESSTVIFLGFI